jgi:hypothetical protein
MDFIEFNHFVFLNYFLINDIITKINNHIIEHQTNVGMII